MAQVLVTNNGAHAPETWAMATAEQLVPVQDLQGTKLMDARKLQLKVADALVPHHAKVQDDEKAKLAENADEHFASAHDAAHYVDEVVNTVMETARGTAFEEHFSKPEVHEAVKDVVSRHFISAMDIERQWHARKNPSDAGDQYLMKIHGSI